MNLEREQSGLVRTLQAKGIEDRAVLQAIGKTHRDRFVPEDQRAAAYDDNALPLGEGQTISQPYIVALMTEALRLTGSEIVLEIGTGSGYQAAILSQLCRRVISIERIESLSHRARDVLQDLGYTNVELHVGDGTLGWPSEAPYDGIIVTAAAPGVPEPLYAQLAPGGRLAIPVGSESLQTLQLVVRRPTQPQVLNLCECHFVPLIGAEGWPEDEPG